MEPIIKQAIDITVYGGKAYLPTLMRNPGKYGGFSETDPIHVVDLNKQELLLLIHRLLHEGYNLGPDLTPEETAKRAKDSPLLRATKAKSWKALNRNGIGYYINWLEDKVEVYISRKGSGEWDPDRNRTLPLDVSLEQIVDIILNDFRSR